MPATFPQFRRLDVMALLASGVAGMLVGQHWFEEVATVWEWVKSIHEATDNGFASKLPLHGFLILLGGLVGMVPWAVWMGIRELGRVACETRLRLQEARQKLVLPSSKT